LRPSFGAAAGAFGAALVPFAQLFDRPSPEGDDPERNGEAERRGEQLPFADVRPRRVECSAGVREHPGTRAGDVRAVHVEADRAPCQRDPGEAGEREQRERDACAAGDRCERDPEGERGQADERCGRDCHQRDERHRVLLVASVRLGGGVHRVASFGRLRTWTRPAPISEASASSVRRGPGAAK